jgi:hypothetical protein
MKSRLIGGLNKASQEPAVWSLKEFYDRRNWVLIQRKTGGLGDILMTRLIIEDIKLLHPDLKVAYACPQIFMSAVEDHPFIDKVLDHEKVNPDEYLVKYDITTVCGFTEQKNAPMPSDHRSDIWAWWCGITPTRHNMHINFKPGELESAREKVSKHRKDEKFSVALCPNSAMRSKNLEPNQFGPVMDAIRDMGGYVYGLHSLPVLNFEGPLFIGKNCREFMALVAVADYVISVDSAAFHLAGGMGKPQVGVFAWADGKVYGKYYSNWELVQRHRDNGDWDCGPCYTWGNCPKVSHEQVRKPCITEITAEEIIESFKRLMNKYPYA